MEDSKRRARRRHNDALKRQVLAECEEPGASVAQVALAHGLNSNLVHKWRRLADPKPPENGNATFIPVALATSPVPACADVRIELRRGALSVSVSWPVAASSECAAWLREILR